MLKRALGFGSLKEAGREKEGGREASLWAPPNKDEMEREGGRGENGELHQKRERGKKKS